MTTKVILDYLPSVDDLTRFKISDTQYSIPTTVGNVVLNTKQHSVMFILNRTVGGDILEKFRMNNRNRLTEYHKFVNKQ